MPEELKGEAATKVQVPDTDYAALAESMLSGQDGGDDVLDLGDDEGEGGDQDGEEGQEEEVLTEGEPSEKEEGTTEEEGEEPKSSVEEEGQQQEGEPSPPPDMAKLRQAEVDRLVGVYALSDDDARSMAVEPEKVLPKKLAEMHVGIVEAVVNVLGAQLPAVVAQLSKQEQTRATTEDAFYKKFPALKDKKYRQSVETSIRIARSQDPTAPVDEILTQAGILASLKNRVALPRELLGGADLSGAAAPGTPAKAKQRGFMPANPGASSAGKPKQKNEFEALADDFLSDDRSQ